MEIWKHNSNLHYQSSYFYLTLCILPSTQFCRIIPVLGRQNYNNCFVTAFQSDFGQTRRQILPQLKNDPNSRLDFYFFSCFFTTKLQIKQVFKKVFSFMRHNLKKERSSHDKTVFEKSLRKGPVMSKHLKNHL